MKNHKLIGFKASETKNKMYDAMLLSNTGNLIKVPFGDKRYENYQDKTKLNLYPHLIHGDKERRKFDSGFHLSVTRDTEQIPTRGKNSYA